MIGKAELEEMFFVNCLTLHKETACMCNRCFVDCKHSQMVVSLCLNVAR